MDSVTRLGFVEEGTENSYYLLPEYNPSKVGGKPSWIGGPILGTDDTNCPICNKVMPLLLQIYAPLNEINENAYHRMIFVLCCKNSECYQKDQIIPAQLPKENNIIIDFEEEEEEEEENEEVKIEEKTIKKFNYLTAVCEVCGWRAKSRCAKCKEIRYCGREHQIQDWSNGHNKECNPKSEEIPTTLPVSPISQRRKALPPAKTRRFETSFAFKEFEIVTEPEDEKISAQVPKLQLQLDLESGLLLTNSNQPLEEDDEEDEETLKEKVQSQLELIEMYKEQVKQYHGESFDDESWNKSNEVDGNFTIFQDVIQHNRDQILRYRFGSEPLWVHSKNKPTNIPACKYCSAPRVFEFQIMPQLLYFLSTEQKFSQESIDWGTLLIYSCSASCGKSSDSPAEAKEEFVWRQNLEKLQSQFQMANDE